MRQKENETLRARVAELEEKSEKMRKEWDEIGKHVRNLTEEIERRSGQRSTPK